MGTRRSSTKSRTRVSAIEKRSRSEATQGRTRSSTFQTTGDGLSKSIAAPKVPQVAQRKGPASKSTKNEGLSKPQRLTSTTRSASWSVKDDETLIQARAQGLNWNQIAPKYFPSKSPNACRKRHERLMERQNADQWDGGVKLDVLAQTYMETRREMWSILANRVGEKWQFVEQKCMEKGLKNLNQAYRSAQKKQGTYDGSHDDSGICVTSLSDSEEPDDRPSIIPDVSSPAAMQYSTGYPSQQHRVPSIYSILQQPMGQQRMNPQPIQYATHSCEVRDPPASPTGDSAIVTSPNDNTSSSDNEASPSSGTPTVTPCSEGSESLDPGDLNEIKSFKEMALDRLMVYFYEIFNNTAYSCHQHGSPSSSSKGSGQPPPSSTSGKGRAKRKSGDCNEEGDDDNDTDRPDKRHKSDSDASKSVQQVKRGFACPYFKHNPQKYRKERSCPGPEGWEAIARLKEHLYRRHALPIQCHRCGETFDTEEYLRSHSRTLKECPIVDQEPVEGMSKQQIQKLRNRKSMFRADSEEEKWRIIYIVLFPETKPGQLPSPYYENDGPSKEDKETSPKPHQLIQFEAYISRELPRKVRKELAIAIEKQVGPIEETLKNHMESLVKNCIERLSRDYQQSRRTPTEQSTLQDLVVESCASAPYPPPDHASSLDVLAQYSVPPESTFVPWPLPFTSSDLGQTENSDSAYFSDPSFALPSDPGWSSFTEFSQSLLATEPLEYTGMLSDLDQLPQSTPNEMMRPPDGNGKGKGRATASDSSTQQLIPCSHQYPPRR